MLMSIFLALIIHFCGVNSIMMFTSLVFKNSSSVLSPNDSGIIVAASQLLGVWLSIHLISRVGQKTLMLISCTGVTIFLGTFGIYSFLDIEGFDVTAFTWVPIVCLSLAIFSAHIGIMIVSYTIAWEIMLPEVSP